MYGIDLAEYVRNRRFIALIDYIRGLPAASRYRQALLDDEETAELIVAMEKPSDRERSWVPGIAEFDTYAILQTQTIAAVRQLTGVVAAANGGKYKPQPPPKPVTTVDRVREARRRREVNRLFALFTAPAREE